jgi:hypothetical protein
MVMGYGEDCLMTLTLVSGDSLRLKVTECILGRMGIDTKENGSNVLNMDKEPIFSLMEIFILVNTKMANLMERDNTLGRMVLSTLVSSSMA